MNPFQCTRNLRGTVIKNRSCNTATFNCDKVQSSSCICSGQAVATDMEALKQVVMDGPLERPVSITFDVTIGCSTVPPFQALGYLFQAHEIHSRMTGEVVLTFAESSAKGADDRLVQTVIERQALTGRPLDFPLLKGEVLEVDISGMKFAQHELWLDRQTGLLTGFGTIVQETTLGTVTSTVLMNAEVDALGGTIRIRDSGGDLTYGWAAERPAQSSE